MYALEKQINPKGAALRTAEKVQISRSTVYRYITEPDETCQPKRGRPLEITDDIVQYIDNLIDEEPDN